MISKEGVGESPDLYILYIDFLKTRRGNGEDYALQIMKVLREYPDWVRARDLKRLISCPEATLFRLLDGLTKIDIIEKKKSPRNRNVSSYRLSPSFPEFYFLTDKEMRAEHSQLFNENIDLTFDLIDAKTVLDRHGFIQEYEQERKISRNIGEGYQKWRERKLRERKIKSASLQQIQ